MSETATPANSSSRRWYQRIGPGLVTACVVIGPGSILTSSQVGAKNGYGLSWVVLVTVLFMMVYTTLGARLGVVAEQSPGDLIRRRAGRSLAALIGLGVFFISAAFQFGNNLGVSSAFEVFVGKEPLVWGNAEIAPKTLLSVLVVLFNVLAISFLFVFRNLYRTVERLMMAFVALMLLAFAVNLFFAQPDVTQVARGMVPLLSQKAGTQGKPLLDISVLALVGTTFVITAAFYQAYLVRQKGWGHAELQDGMRDARVGSLIMALITLMIMTTAAAAFHDFQNGLAKVELKDVGQVARQLEPSIGEGAKYLFCLGLFSAAYSSFLVNSMIGGFILSDGLGLGSKPTDLWPRLFTTLVLLTGMGVALYVLDKGTKPVAAIVAAQAVTVIASPLLAGTLLWLTNRHDVMGPDRNSRLVNVAGGLGFLLLLVMAAYTAIGKVWPVLSKWMNGS